VINGDSYINVNFYKIYNFHLTKNALLTIVITKNKMDNDGGSITFNHNLNLINFVEKDCVEKAKYINAGVYILNKKTFDLFPKKDEFSIEKDFFPNFPSHNAFVYKTKKSLYDIGTPEKLIRFQEHIKFEKK